MYLPTPLSISMSVCSLSKTKSLDIQSHSRPLTSTDLQVKGLRIVWQLAWLRWETDGKRWWKIDWKTHSSAVESVSHEPRKAWSIIFTANDISGQHLSHMSAPLKIQQGTIFRIWSAYLKISTFFWIHIDANISTTAPWHILPRTNLIHNFTSMTFPVILAVFRKNVHECECVILCAFLEVFRLKLKKTFLSVHFSYTL